MPFSDDHQRLRTACQLISAGRCVARQLAVSVRRFEVNETEFRLLWLLHESVKRQKRTCIDQRILASELGLSPAQVSTTVEKLRRHGTIEPVVDSNDRRRQLWMLTAEGSKRLEKIKAELKILSRDWAIPEPNSISALPRQEEAA